MCLYIDTAVHQQEHGNLVPHVAENDITVYKIIYINNRAHVTNFQYKKRKTYTGLSYGEPNHTFIMGGVEPRIEGGYFHAYTGFTRKLGYYYATKLTSFTIPKGTKYYLGVYGQIASQVIRSGNLKPLDDDGEPITLWARLKKSFEKG